MRDRKGWELPLDADDLIEGVYGGTYRVPDEWLPRLSEAERVEENGEAKSLDISSLKKISDTHTNVIESYELGLDDDEENPEKHRFFQAITRLSEPSVICVCLHEDASGELSLHRDGSKKVPNGKPCPAMVRLLVERSVSISNQPYCSKLIEAEPPQEWKNLPMLKNYRVLKFRNGVARIEGTNLVCLLDDRLGIVLGKTEPSAV